MPEQENIITWFYTLLKNSDPQDWDSIYQEALKRYEEDKK